MFFFSERRRTLRTRPTVSRPTRGDQRGYTMVELLFTMFLSVALLAAGVYGLSLTFDRTTALTTRTETSARAEALLERLTLDLRSATPCPSYNSTYPTGAGGEPVKGLLVSPGPELQFCGPLPGGPTSPPTEALFTWECNQGGSGTTAGLCTRTWAPITCGSGSGAPAATTTCASGAPVVGATQTVSAPIYGVGTVALTGTVAGASTELLSDAGCEIGNSGEYSYGIASGSSCPISWVALQAQLYNLVDSVDPGDSANFRVLSSTSSLTVSIGAALRNFGT